MTLWTGPSYELCLMTKALRHRYAYNVRWLSRQRGTLTPSGWWWHQAGRSECCFQGALRPKEAPQVDTLEASSFAASVQPGRAPPLLPGVLAAARYCVGKVARPSPGVWAPLPHFPALQKFYTLFLQRKFIGNEFSRCLLDKPPLRWRRRSIPRTESLDSVRRRTAWAVHRGG